MKGSIVVTAYLLFISVCLCSNTTIISSNGQLNSQWQDWSWSASITYGSNSVQFQNQPSTQVSITQAWGAFSAHSISSIPMNTVTELSFQLNGGLNLEVSFVDSSNNVLFQHSLPSNQRPSNQWTLITIPVSNVQGTLAGIWVQDNSGTSQTYYIDNMILTTGTSSGGGSTGSSAWWNGLNVPWDNFGYDIGTSTPFNTSWFQQFFSDCDANDVNSVRFWLHCDGRGSPLFYSDGEVSGLSSTFLSNLNTLVNMAKQSNVVILITLWSFDMCNQEVSNGLHPDLISNQTKTTTYLNNALIPMLNSIGTFDNVIWEVINEPEWCISETPPSTLVSVPLQQMQRFVAMIANTIHTHSSQKVTVGSASLKWNSDVSPAVGNWWSDSGLKAAYSASGSYLDFYQSKSIFPFFF